MTSVILPLLHMWQSWYQAYQERITRRNLMTLHFESRGLQVDAECIHTMPAPHFNSRGHFWVLISLDGIQTLTGWKNLKRFYWTHEHPNHSLKFINRNIRILHFSKISSLFYHHGSESNQRGNSIVLWCSLVKGPWFTLWFAKIFFTTMSKLHFMLWGRKLL